MDKEGPWPKYINHIRYPRNMYGREGNYCNQNDRIIPNPYGPKYQGNSLDTALRAMTSLTKGRFENAKELVDKLVTATGKNMNFISYLNG